MLMLALCAALVIAQLALPKRFAMLPLLFAASNLPNSPVIEIGVSFTTCKLVILAGLMRAIAERRFFWEIRNPLDATIGIWAAFALLSSLAHSPEDHNPLTIRLSLIYDIAGTYLYARSFIKNISEFLFFIKCLLISLVPLAISMVFEKITGKNFSWFIVFGTLAESATRSGRVRAGGPFAHSILAGTVGAISLLLFLPLRKSHRTEFLLGCVLCLIIVYCSSSSGPIMSLLAGLFAVGIWFFRRYLGVILTTAAILTVALHIVMNDPVWYLLARIDITGGSTGFHRARLISAALEHLDRWWLAGTDYTRDWVPYGIDWSASHVDITNYFLKMGVNGGLPLMISFMALFWLSFRKLGKAMRILRSRNNKNEFYLWCLGSALFAHCATFISVSYYDQSYIYFAVLIGAVPGLSTIAPAISKEELAGASLAK
jgi:hypothetical protein